VIQSAYFPARWPGESIEHYLAVITSDPAVETCGIPLIAGCDTAHQDHGDVVALNPSGRVRTLYRRRSASNSLFATERCNSFCLMCSQPPRNVDDSWRVNELLRTVQLMDPETGELGITGGEPTLLGQGAGCGHCLPRPTASNVAARPV
jgi:hypothetical protein